MQKLLRFRQHQLTDAELAEIAQMDREAAGPSDPGRGPYPYQHLMLPRGEPYISPEEEAQAAQMPEGFAKQFPGIAEGWQGVPGNLDLMRDLRRNLEDPEKAIYVLAAYTEQWENIYQTLVELHQSVEGMWSRLDQLEVRRMHEQRDHMQKITDKIMSTMMTAVLPIVESYRGTLWRMMEQVGPGGWTVTEPVAGVPSRVVVRADWIEEWLKSYANRKVKADNVAKAARSAWNRFRRANQYTGRLLIRHSVRRAQDEIAGLIEELEGLLLAVDDLAQAVEPFAEEDRIMDIAMNIQEQPLEKAAKLMSPDELRRYAQNDPFDLTEFVTGVPGAPVARPAEPAAPATPAAPPRPPGVMPGTEALEPLPIDEDEFMRLRFPEVSRYPSDRPWSKIQFAAGAGDEPHLVQITYQKVTPPEDGMVKTYIVEPYSMRRRRSQSQGGQTLYYFFGFDTLDMHIKSFIYRNIQDVKIMSDTFDPRWQVEFYWG